VSTRRQKTIPSQLGARFKTLLPTRIGEFDVLTELVLKSEHSLLDPRIREHFPDFRPRDLKKKRQAAMMTCPWLGRRRRHCQSCLGALSERTRTPRDSPGSPDPRAFSFPAARFKKNRDIGVEENERWLDQRRAKNREGQ